MDNIEQNMSYAYDIGYAIGSFKSIAWQVREIQCKSPEDLRKLAYLKEDCQKTIEYLETRHKQRNEK